MIEPQKESILAKEARLLEEQNKIMEEENKDKNRLIEARNKNIELKKERALLSKQAGEEWYMKYLKNKGVILIIMAVVGFVVILLMRGC